MNLRQRLLELLCRKSDNDYIHIQDELAVHKRKVEDVRGWLTDAFDGGPTGALRKYRVRDIVIGNKSHLDAPPYKRILALTGHAGTGKTTTLRILAREMDFEILEWRNSFDDNFSGDRDEYGQ